MDAIFKPVGYSLLALFILLELNQISFNVDQTGRMGGLTKIAQVLTKAGLCQFAMASINLILGAITSISVYLVVSINKMGISGKTGNIVNATKISNEIADMGFIGSIIPAILIMLVALVVLIATISVKIMVLMRYLELYVYLSVAPIPIGTLPSNEFSSIAKNFFKKFAAISLQGVLLFLVISFFPVIINGVFKMNEANIYKAVFAMLGYSLALLLAIMKTGDWSKSIMNAQ